MKRVVYVFLTVILLVTVVFSTFLPVFANSNSPASNEPDPCVEVGGICENCGE